MGFVIFATAKGFEIPVSSKSNSCRLNRSAGVPLQAPKPKFTDLVYDENDKDPQKLDIYWPHQPSISTELGFKTLLVVHGGCFSYGDKSGDDLTDPISRLLNAGYAVVSLNYHKSDPLNPDPEKRYPYPKAEEDVWQALIWLRMHASQYQIDTNKMSVLGYSAGATLAAEVGIKSAPMNVQNKFSLRDKSSKEDFYRPLPSVVDLFGRMDFVTPSADKSDVNGKPWDCAERYLQKSRSPEVISEFESAGPVHDLSKSSARFLIVHGSKDTTVETEQSRTMYKTLRSTSGRKKSDKLVIIDGANHMLTSPGGRAWTDQVATDMAWDSICEFLHQELK